MEFMRKFNPDKRLVKEFDYWIICLREKQVTLGDAVILLKRQVQSIGEMTANESAEFASVISWYENKCVELFNADKFNYVVAMMKDNFVHYHAFPRYSKSVDFNGEEWIDQDWPRLVQFKDVSIPDEKLQQLVNVLKET
jgi:diadenosine tetraphosphate (Ap4A) HIT family hydrolase